MSDKLDNPVTGKPNIAAPPAHDHGKDANSRMLVFALILTSTFLVVEVIGSFVFNSLALLSDAGHMLTDVAALAIALMTIQPSRVRNRSVGPELKLRLPIGWR